MSPIELPEHRTYQEGVAEGVRRVHRRHREARTTLGMVAVGLSAAAVLALQLWERVRQ